ncbi:MAG: PD-(D/E)XK nuclease family protein [Treponema sp.]|nr:PD-(D/E)XK nuclease family protein [Treponema sp.]
MNENDKVLLANIITAFLQAQKDNQRFLHYNLNLIEECHANENAHTRILLKLLNFEDSNGDKIFLKDFILLLNEQLEKYSIAENSKSQSYSIAGQFAYIDGYICSEEYAIILENKINGAVDQFEQIQSYIQKIENQTYNVDKIFVVYLTNDGSKKSQMKV